MFHHASIHTARVSGREQANVDRPTAAVASPTRVKRKDNPTEVFQPHCN